MTADELVISYSFPPSGDISGIVMAKRIIAEDKRADVLTCDNDSAEDLFTSVVGKYIENRYTVSVNLKRDLPEAVKEFIDKSWEVISGEYKTVTSRSWALSNHFFAFEYKLKHPGTFWRAEFSDPLLYNVENKVNLKDKYKIDDEDYFKKINREIENLGYEPLDNSSSVFLTAEYLTFLFADEIVFTNKNQRDLMVKQFPVDVKDMVYLKSKISPHPTLPHEFYSLKKSDIKLDDDYINLAYFGDYYYGKRHFEGLFYALESLNHRFKDKIRLYIFISNKKLLKDLTDGLDFGENIFIKTPLDYLEFLNASTLFDVLIVNDLDTDGVWPENPYLPSKISDYLGSGRDIWAISEKNSPLSKIDVKYKSDIHDYTSNIDALVKILKDKGFDDENWSSSDDYFEKRLTYLNKLLEKSYARKSRKKSKKKKSKQKLFDRLKL